MIRPAPIDTIRERHRVTQDGRRDPRSIGLAMPKGFREKKGCVLSSGEVLPGAPPALEVDLDGFSSPFSNPNANEGLRRSSHAPPSSCSAWQCLPGAGAAVAGRREVGHELDPGGAGHIPLGRAPQRPASAEEEETHPNRVLQVMRRNACGGTPGLVMLTYLSVARAAQVTRRASQRTSRCCRRRTPASPPEYRSSHDWAGRAVVGGAVAAGDNTPTTAPSGGSPSSPASSRAPVRPPRTPPCPPQLRLAAASTLRSYLLTFALSLGLCA